VPQRVHRDVLENRITPYSTEEAPTQAPFSVSAVPVSITVVVLAIGWLLTLPPVRGKLVDEQEVWTTALTPTATPVTFAFLGAYFFAIQMLFRRYVRSDLRGSAYVAVVMRIVIALIGIWVITGFAKATPWGDDESKLLLVGFAVGVFPVVAWQITRNIMVKIFRFALPSLQPEMALNCLDGLTVWHEARLEEEDIENVPNMATADIVSLLISTRFPADRIVDWVDEAILLTYLGPSQVSKSDQNSARQLLASHGIRTASALLATSNSTADRGQLTAFNEIVVDNAGRSVIPSLITSIQTNTNLGLVLRWRGLPAGMAVRAGQST
jgi:F0F1-type ATP synthase assembly protein I